MDPQMMNVDGGGVYNLSEIWPGFQMNTNGSGLDPMVMDQQRSNSNSNSNNQMISTSPNRKRQDDCAKTGTSTSNNNRINGNNNNIISNNSTFSKRQKGVVLVSDHHENNNNNNLENTSSKVEQVDIGNSDKAALSEQQPAPEPRKQQQDYIHVRARRGQATDSHSLAERARREKISDRMKILQDLVPGCNKVIGKALVLDEIINYIQSLQRQVEFLSMKLEAVNARVSIDGYPSKDFAQQTFNAPGMAFGSQSSREYGRGSSPEWLHMQIGGGFERTS